MAFTELNQALREQRVDIAIRGRYRDDAEFNYLPLYTETHRVYVSGRIADRKAGRGLPWSIARIRTSNRPCARAATRAGRMPAAWIRWARWSPPVITRASCLPITANCWKSVSP